MAKSVAEIRAMLPPSGVFTLPTSGQIAASDINVELGRAFNAPFNLNGNAERALAGVPSGQIKFSDFYGKSNDPVNTIHDIRAYYASDDYDRASTQARSWISTSGTQLSHSTDAYQGGSSALPPVAPNIAVQTVPVFTASDWALVEYMVSVPALDVYHKEGNANETPIVGEASGVWNNMPVGAGPKTGIHCTVNTDVFSSDRSAARYINVVYSFRLKGETAILHTLTSRVDAESYSES
jgi:hypothetical protein